MILGANLLVVLWCGFVTLRVLFRGRNAGRPLIRCAYCGDMSAEFSIDNVQGKFCEECWYELAEGLMIAKLSSDNTKPDAPHRLFTEEKK